MVSISAVCVCIASGCIDVYTRVDIMREIEGCTRCAAGKRAIEDAHGLAICILGIGYSWFMYVWVKVIFPDRMLCLEL